MAKTNKYEYETSPRKYQPNYAPTRKKTVTKNNIEQEKIKAQKQKEKQKVQKNKKAKMIGYLILGFAIVFAICYRNAQIDEKFAEIKELKSNLAYIEKENAQIGVMIESELNLTNLAQEAKELLGMQKLNSKQTVYANLQKKDYIETVAENVVIEEETTWNKIVTTLKNLFK